MAGCLTAPGTRDQSHQAKSLPNDQLLASHHICAPLPHKSGDIVGWDVWMLMGVVSSFLALQALGEQGLSQEFLACDHAINKTSLKLCYFNGHWGSQLGRWRGTGGRGVLMPGSAESMFLFRQVQGKPGCSPTACYLVPGWLATSL